MPVKVILTLACEDDYFAFVDNRGLDCVDTSRSPYEVLCVDVKVGNDKPRRLSKLRMQTKRPSSPALEVLITKVDLPEYLVALLRYPRVKNSDGVWEARPDLSIRTVGDFLFISEEILMGFYGIKSKRIKFINEMIVRRGRINQAVLADSSNHFE